MIKKIHLLVFMIFCSAVFSQSVLNGRYIKCYGAVDNGECLFYTFNKNGIFETDTEGELGKVSYGKGHYTIKNDSLILNYDLTELKYKSCLLYTSPSPRD